MRLEVAVSFWFLNRNLVVLNLNPVVAGEIKKKIKIMIKKPRIDRRFQSHPNRSHRLNAGGISARIPFNARLRTWMQKLNGIRPFVSCDWGTSHFRLRLLGHGAPREIRTDEGAAKLAAANGDRA